MAPTLPHFVWVAGRDPARCSVSSACPDLRRQAGSRRRQPLGGARALGRPGGAQDIECLFKIPKFITVVGDEQEDGVLCSANVRRPAGSPLISLRRAPHPPARQSLSVCMREYQHRLRQDGWVSDAVRSRRSSRIRCCGCAHLVAIGHARLYAVRGRGTRTELLTPAILACAHVRATDQHVDWRERCVVIYEKINRCLTLQFCSPPYSTD
jgi:hypothetical protein